MIKFTNINSSDRGQSVRGKLNNMFRDLIEGAEGINNLWKSLLTTNNTLKEVSNKTDTQYSDLKNGIQQSYDHTDRSVGDLKAELTEDIEQFEDEFNAAISDVKDNYLRNKGYFDTLGELQEKWPTSEENTIAYVGYNYPYRIYKFKGGKWVDTQQTGGNEEVNLGNYVKYEDLGEI